MAYDPLQDYRMANNMPTPPIDLQRAGMGLPMNGAMNIPQLSVDQLQPVQPALPAQNQQNNYLSQVLSQQMQDRQDTQNSGGLIQQIMAQRMQPNMQDVQQTSYMRAMNPTQVVTPDQVMASRFSQQLSPYTQALGLQKTQSEIGLQGAQTDALNNQLSRQLALMKYQYANDPAMAQAKAMATYMASLGGQPQPNTAQPSIPSTNTIQPRDASFMPVNGQSSQLPAQRQQDNFRQQQGGVATTPQNTGFNPMGALLAKQLGLTDMQIGPNGQPMPIPGATKIENGEVVTFGPDGVPTKVVPTNPKARQTIEDNLTFLSQKLDELKSVGAAVDEGQTTAQNLTNKALSLPVAQPFQAGTKAQSIRNEMASYIMQSMPDYMAAKGITPGMERSLGGQEMILKAVGIDPGNSVQASKASLANLSKIAGTGEYAKSYSSQAQTSPIQEGATATNQQTGQKIIFKNGQWSGM